jgi:hypothetical protein
VTDAEVTAITRAATPSIRFYVVSIGLAIVAPTIAALGYLLIGLVAAARARGDDEVTAA